MSSRNRAWLWSLPAQLPELPPRERPHEMLREILEEQGMTAADLAHSAGFSLATIEQALKGEIKLSLGQLKVVAEAFGISGEALEKQMK